MLMNRIETWAMNNPVRLASQRWFEATWLKRHGGGMGGGTALEVGCGRGEGVRIILDRFGADRVIAIDLDPDQVDRARHRLSPAYDARAEVRVGDAADLDLPDASVDAVFDFGILHHVPPWRAALAEIARVLRPGGRFYFEEALRGFLDTTLIRALTRHPEEGYFTADEFLDAVRAAGLEVEGKELRLGPWFVLGTARRPPDRASNAARAAAPRANHTH